MDFPSSVGNAPRGETIDPRDWLERCRRNELYRYADAWGIEYPQDCPATDMRAILRSHGKTGQIPPVPIADRPKQRKPKGTNRQPIGLGAR